MKSALPKREGDRLTSTAHKSPLSTKPPSSSVLKPKTTSSPKPAAPKPSVTKPKPSSSKPKPSPSAPKPSVTTLSPVQSSPDPSFARKNTVTHNKYDKNKQADPFATTKKHKSNFAIVYSNGGIPCRINHGGVKHSLQWDTPPEELDYDPLLITCAEGLIETDHPYVFISRLGFKEMLEAQGATEKAIPLIPRIVPHIREAMRSPNNDIFQAGLAAIEQLSNATGAEVVPHLSALLVAMNKRMSDKSSNTAINNVLQQIAQIGGPKAQQIIKSKIPTFTFSF